jgi:hypothetical protein
MCCDLLHYKDYCTSNNLNGWLHTPTCKKDWEGIKKIHYILVGKTVTPTAFERSLNTSHSIRSSPHSCNKKRNILCLGHFNNSKDSRYKAQRSNWIGTRTLDY